MMTRHSVWVRLTGVAFFSMAIACAGDGTGPDPDNGGGDGMSLLARDVQPILTANCAFNGCHGGNDPAVGQNLSTGQTFANVVGVASVQLPSMNRVTAGDPANSYLVHKIEGTQASVGGSGSQMPRGRSPLSSAQIATIRAWITAGALNN